MAIVSCPFVAGLTDADALLDKYRGLVCWAESLMAAGAGVVTVLQRFEREAELERNGVCYRFIDDGGPPGVPPWTFGVGVAKAAAAARADVVHVDGMTFPLLVRHVRLRAARGSAVVVQDHGGIHAGSPGFQSCRWRALYRFGLRAADGFLFTDSALAAPWQRARILHPRQPIYEVAESSTELAASHRSRRRSALDAPATDVAASPTDVAALPGPDAPPTDVAALPGRPACLWVGRLDHNKDPLTVLAGFERATTALPEAALTMVFGEDELLAQVRERVVASPALSRRVHLLGRLDHEALADLYAAADFFLLGSHHEGSGYALIEALAFGVTPVVTDIPAFRALTGGGHVGALFPVGAEADMAANLVRLAAAADAHARRTLVRAHFARALSWPALGRLALAAYRQAHAARCSP